MSWEKVKLNEICISIADGDHQPPPKTDKGIPFVTIANITKSNQFDFSDTMFVSSEYYDSLDCKRKAKKDDILYSVVGSFGIPVYIKEEVPFVFQRHIAILRPSKERIIPQFLYYTMLSKSFYMQADAVAVGAAQRTVSLTALRNMEIKIPKINIQEKIVKILSAYDDLIENNQKQIKLLEEAAQRLYKEWFVDLRFPGYENTKIVDGVPEGWKTLHISDVCDTIGGGTPSTKVKEYYQDGNIPWVTPTDITKNNSLVLLGTATKITNEGLNNSSAKMVPPGTILMTSRASVGFFGICDFPVCTNQGFISCIPYQQNMQMYLLYNLLSRVDEIRGKAGGSTYLEISKKIFRDFEIIVPDTQLLNMFQTTTEKSIELLRILSKQIIELQEARDRLLPKLMSGELEV